MTDADNERTAGVEHILIGMPHRGRLNLLTDSLKYPPRALFHKIKGNSELPEWLGAKGDVISHLGTHPFLLIVPLPQIDLWFGIATIAPIKIDDRTITVQLLQNPSHLGT